MSWMSTVCVIHSDDLGQVILHPSFILDLKRKFPTPVLLSFVFILPFYGFGINTRQNGHWDLTPRSLFLKLWAQKYFFRFCRINSISRQDVKLTHFLTPILFFWRPNLLKPYNFYLTSYNLYEYHENLSKYIIQFLWLRAIWRHVEFPRTMPFSRRVREDRRVHKMFCTHSRYCVGEIPKAYFPSLCVYGMRWWANYYHHHRRYDWLRLLLNDLKLIESHRLCLCVWVSATFSLYSFVYFDE